MIQMDQCSPRRRPLSWPPINQGFPLKRTTIGIFVVVLAGAGREVW